MLKIIIFLFLPLYLGQSVLFFLFFMVNKINQVLQTCRKTNWKNRLGDVKLKLPYFNGRLLAGPFDSLTAASPLQKVRHLVRLLRPQHPRHGLGAPGQGQRVPPGLLRLLLLQEAAFHRRGVRPGGGEGAVQGALRLHAGQPQAGRGERCEEPGGRAPRSPCQMGGIIVIFFFYFESDKWKNIKLLPQYSS